MHSLEIVSTSTRHAPTDLESANKLIKRVNNGELSLTQAISQSGQPIRKVLEAYVQENEIPSDLMLRVRRTRLNRAALNDDIGIAFGAIKLLQDEDKIAPPEETGGMSGDLVERGRKARKLLDDRQAEQARKEEKEIMEENENN